VISRADNRKHEKMKKTRCFHKKFYVTFGAAKEKKRRPSLDEASLDVT